MDLEDCLDFYDSFMGGCINGCVLYKWVVKVIKIYYVDFIFLYFFVNKICCYLVGYFEIVIWDFVDFFFYFGFVKVKVILFWGFFYLVLGYWIGGKLIFFFCWMCVEC